MSSDPSSHSDPIPISSNANANRPRAHSVSDPSDEVSSSPSESPSHSPSSSMSASLTTPLSTSLRGPMSPVSPTSPIMSYIYGSPGKNPFVSQNALSDDPEKDQGHPAPHRRMSTWVPVRFNHQYTKPVNDTQQQQRGAGILRRLSLSVPGSGKAPTSTTATATAKQDGGTKPAPTPPPGPRSPRRATLSPGSSNNKPRAPSPMGERILKGHYDGF